MRLISLFIVFLFLLYSVSAFEVSPQKQNYVIGETLIVKIQGNFQQELNENNIVFKKSGTEIPFLFNLLKFNSNTYYLYSILESAGNYEIVVKNVLYESEGSFKGEPVSASFVVNHSFSSIYIDLINSITNWDSLSVEENAWALIALSFDSNLSSLGKSALMRKSKNRVCWPSPNCSVKETALAILALSKVDPSLTSLPAEWLADAENNLNIGAWSMEFSSSEAMSCTLSILNSTSSKNVLVGPNSIELNLRNSPENVTILLSCPSVSPISNYKIVHVYKGAVTEFNLTKTNEGLSISLNNQRCFGTHYRTECNPESTAFALYSLKKSGKSFSTTWFENNTETNTIQKSILFYLTESDSARNWLFSNQAEEGYWTTRTLGFSNTPDIESTVFASSVIPASEERKKSIEWILSQRPNSIKEKSLLLTLFSAEEIPSVFSVYPGSFLLKLKEVFELKVTNKGIATKSVQAKFLNQSQTYSINPGKTQTFSFVSPLNLSTELEANITLSYPASSSWFFGSSSQEIYSIPVYILPFAQLEFEVLPSQFYFVLDSPYLTFLNLTILENQRLQGKLKLKNTSPKRIDYISIIPSHGLSELINSTNITYLSSGDTKEISLEIMSSKSGYYEGIIEAYSSSPPAYTNISVFITVTKDPSKVNLSGLNISKTEETCEELNGTVCKPGFKCKSTTIITYDEENCCISECIKKSSYNWVILIAGILILIGIIYFLLKRKKHLTKEELIEQIKKQQVPPPYQAYPEFQKLKS